MSRREEQALAARLARALDGQERPDGDLATLVTVLERATETARFEIAEDAVERELARVRPRLERGRRPSRPRPASSRLAVAFAAVAAAAVAIVVFTFVRVPGTDVEAKARSALRGLLEIHERIEPARRGAFPVSTRTVWLDPRGGLVKTVQFSGGKVVEETLVKPNVITRFLPRLDLAIVASSCRAFASGCADTVDPVAFYRRALEQHLTVKTKKTGDNYELTLPVQTLPDAVRVEQVVTIDADTYRPEVIEWREQAPGGKLHPVSRIVIESIERFSPDENPDPFHLSLLDSTRIQQRTVSQAPLRKLSERRLTLGQARAVKPTLIGISRRPLRIESVRWNSGTVYRLDYGAITVWNYRSPVPPSLVSSLIGGPAKVVPVGDNVARFYEAPGERWLVEVDTPSWSVVIQAPGQGKVDIFRLAGLLKPLR